MKKKITLLLILIGPILMAQSIFDKFESHESVSYVSISPRLFQMMASINIDESDAESMNLSELANNINSFKLLRTENDQISKEFADWVDRHASSKNLEELMRVRDGSTKVKFYVKSSKNVKRVEELLMLVSDAEIPDVDVDIKPQTVLLVIKGNIDLDRISVLTKKMNLPGSDELNKLNENDQNE